MTELRHASLFSGIGGFELAAEWAGWVNVLHCEINPFGRKVLNHYWPNSVSYEDITKTDFSVWRGRIDIISGGFPCQPFSLAGKRKGTEDDRHLWPEMLRVIREVRPTWVVGENVFGIINWDGGLVFEQVQADLEAEGYEVQPYVLPAVSVNAPHRRDRTWFVAHASGNGWKWGRSGNATKNGEQQRPNEDGELERGLKGFCTSGTIAHTGLQRQEKRQEQPMGTDKLCQKWPAADTNILQRRKRGMHQIRSETTERYTCTLNSRQGRNDWQDFPTQPPICSGDDGISSRLDGITFPKWRNESIKAYGNAIVPQVAYQIFKAINLFHHD